MRLFKPEILIGWHRAIVRRRWTVKQSQKLGRPPIDRDQETWILQVARDNPTLGYGKFEGELRKVDVGVSSDDDSHGLAAP